MFDRFGLSVRDGGARFRPGKPLTKQLDLAAAASRSGSKSSRSFRHSAAVSWGERPTDPAKARAWDRGLGVIEAYRQRNGVTDRTRAFGSEPKERAAEDWRRLEIQRLRSDQQELGRGARRPPPHQGARDRAGFGARAMSAFHLSGKVYAN